MELTNIITADLDGKTSVQTRSVYQFDYGQKLVIEGADLPETYQVHFCNKGDESTLSVTGDASGVMIPDECLMNARTIIAYIFLHVGEDDGETVYKISIPVKRREQPTDITPTPQQHDALTQALIALNEAIASIEGLTVSAVALGEDEAPTATKVVDPETGAIDIVFGIPAGHAPVRGVDYWTEADKDEIVQSVIDSITGGRGKVLITGE